MIQDASREREVLACFARAPEYLRTTFLKPEHFSDAQNRAIFRAMKTLDNGVISFAEIQRELERRSEPVSVPYLGEIIKLQPDAVEYLALKALSGRLIEDATRASALSAAQEALTTLRDPTRSLSDGLSALSRTVVQAERSILSQASSSVGDLIASGLGEGFGRKFMTGIGPLDNVTYGWREGEIANINAPYKAYKTRWTLNLVLRLLNMGVHVSYDILEDNAAALVKKLIAMQTGLQEHIVRLYFDDDCPAEAKKAVKSKVEMAMDWLKDQPLQIYDAKHGVHDIATLPERFAADKMQHDTHIHILDHVNQFGDDNETMGTLYRSFVPLAQENQLFILALSQQSNDTMKFGTNNNMLATRGTGVAGAVVHWGFEIKYNPSKTAAYKVVDKDFLAQLESRKVKGHNLQIGDGLKEVGLWLKVLRTGPQTKFWGLFEPTSGRLIDIRSDNPAEETTGSFTNWDWES